MDVGGALHFQDKTWLKRFESDRANHMRTNFRSSVFNQPAKKLLLGPRHMSDIDTQYLDIKIKILR